MITFLHGVVIQVDNSHYARVKYYTLSTTLHLSNKIMFLNSYEVYFAIENAR